MVGNDERASHMTDSKGNTARGQSKMRPLRVCHKLLYWPLTLRTKRSPSVREELLTLALLDSELMGRPDRERSIEKWLLTTRQWAVYLDLFPMKGRICIHFSP